jgi:hypothetical protein
MRRLHNSCRRGGPALDLPIELTALHDVDPQAPVVAVSDSARLRVLNCRAMPAIAGSYLVIAAAGLRVGNGACGSQRPKDGTMPSAPHPGARRNGRCGPPGPIDGPRGTQGPNRASSPVTNGACEVHEVIVGRWPRSVPRVLRQQKAGEPGTARTSCERAPPPGWAAAAPPGRPGSGGEAAGRSGIRSIIN